MRSTSVYLLQLKEITALILGYRLFNSIVHKNQVNDEVYYGTLNKKLVIVFCPHFYSTD